MLINNQTIYLSKKGFKDIRKKINKLNKQLNSSRMELRELDRVDSKEGKFLKIEKLEKINLLENEITELEHSLKNAKLLPRKRDRLKVAIGSIVDLADQSGRLLTYKIVSGIEADPIKGKISINSPLGKSLIGKKVYDTIEWTNSKLITRQIKLVGIH